MLTLIVTTGLIFQISVAIYLFNFSRIEDDFDKNMIKLLVVLFMQIAIKLILLIWLRNEWVFGRIASPFGLSYGPLLYFTANELVHRQLSRRKYLLHMFPFLTFSVIYFALIAGYLTRTLDASLLVNYTTYFQWLVVASLLTYAYVVRQTLHKGSREEDIPVVQINLTDNIAVIFLIGMTAGTLLELTQWIHVPFPGFQLRFLPYAFFCIIPILILQYKLTRLKSGNELVHKNLEEISESEEDLPLISHHQEKRYQKSAVGEKTMDLYEQSLIHYMVAHKPFLDAELSLESLSRDINIPKHHLTQVLNDRLGKNFYHFINEYRIEEAKKRLDQMNGHNELSLLSLAYDCGFNSKSSFNNYFKKITGRTPSFYRKHHNTSTATS